MPIRLTTPQAESNRMTTFYVTIWAEQNGAVVNDRWNYSFGNGNEHRGAGINDWGYVTHYPYEIVSMSIGMRTTNTADTTIVVTANGVATPAQLTIVGAQTKAFGPVVHSGPAGDTLNFQTVENGGANDVVVSLLIKYTLS